MSGAAEGYDHHGGASLTERVLNLAIVSKSPVSPAQRESNSRDHSEGRMPMRYGVL